jgi:hypothetical protein
MLPDDVLLAIFDFCVADAVTEWSQSSKSRVKEDWQTLVQVCRLWRSLAFASPRRLNLRLVCTPGTPAMDTLDVWPPLPLLISNDYSDPPGIDNIIAVLKRSNRVCQISLRYLISSQLEEISAAMQVSFPELTDLTIHMNDETRLVIPDSFLGGSASHLRSLYLAQISFPGLPKLLLSATRLVNLCLHDIPRSGCFSPEVMVTCLSALTSLKFLQLGPFSDPETQCLSPRTPSTLPSLTHLKFMFGDDSAYLEDLVARINAPGLINLEIRINSEIDFDTSQLVHFISRTPRFKACNEIHLAFGVMAIWVRFPLRPFDPQNIEELRIKISQRVILGWQVISLAQVCTSTLPPISASAVEHLYIYHNSPQPHWHGNIESTLWLELLGPFIAVKNLYISKEYVPHILPVLQQIVGDRMTELLPMVQNLFLEGYQSSGPHPEGIGMFISVLLLSGRTMTFFHWDRDSDRDRFRI